MSGVEEKQIALTVLIPIVERHDDLREVYRSVVPEMEKIGRPYEFVFLVSAEFTEAFDQVLELHEDEPKTVRVLRFARPVSEAAALATGFERARGKVVFTVPSYFDADPKGLSKLLDAINGGADLAFANRTERTDGWVKKVQAAGFNRLASWATGTKFVDIASPTRAVYREIVQELPLYGDFHRFLPVLADRVGFNVQSVPVPQDARASAPAVYRPRTYLYRALDLLSIFFLSHYTRRPLRLFGAVGALFGAVGGGIMLWLGVARLLGDPIAGRPILILGTLLLGLGVQAFTIGLLGELLLFFQARDVRDYRVAEVFESAESALPMEPPTA